MLPSSIELVKHILDELPDLETDIQSIISTHQ